MRISLRSGSTSLLVAIEVGNLEIAKTLLGTEADTNIGTDVSEVSHRVLDVTDVASSNT